MLNQNKKKDSCELCPLFSHTIFLVLPFGTMLLSSALLRILITLNGATKRSTMISQQTPTRVGKDIRNIQLRSVR